MKNEKLIRSIGSVADKYVREAAPQNKATDTQQIPSPKRKMLRYSLIAACMAVFVFTTTVFAASYIQNSITSFYLRYLSPQEMAVANSIAAQYGADIYFDALKSGDLYKQYFAVNKLVEYYNDEEIRERAIRAIIPLLSDAPYDRELSDLDIGALSDAASFALSVLTKTFDDPRIIHMADGTIVFTLFNNYSDYGTYNQIWIIQDDELRELVSFNEPKMYITQLIPSPDKNLFAITLCSNKSNYIVIWDIVNRMVSPELVDSARFMVAQDRNIVVWQRMDNENYSGAWNIEWIDNDSIEFHASLWYSVMGAETDIHINNIHIRYNFRKGQMEYSIQSSD
jgi:hypothetical protein